MTPTKQTRVLDAHTAIVDGQWTGLCGCKSPLCLARAGCLRADPVLTGDIGEIAAARCISGERSHFIPVEVIA